MAPLVAVVQAALVAYAPGAALFRLPWGDRARRSALPAEERVFWHVMVSLAVSLGTVIALGALEAYKLERLLAVDAAVVLMAFVAGRGNLRLEGAPRPTLSVILPVAIVVLGTWLYFPTAEYVMGGKDPGVYLSEGIQIAQRGTLAIHEKLVASVPSVFRDLFFRRAGEPYYGVRFMGFFLFDPGTGRVVGQFPHLFPASIAVAYGIAGLDAARSAVALWAVLGLVAVYFTAERLIGRLGAFLAAGLLAVNVIEVWYGRYPNAEVAFQALLLAGVFATDRALADRDRFFEVVAPALLGLLLFLRIESVLGLFAVTASLALASLHGQRLTWRFFVVLALVGALGTWYQLSLLIGYSSALIGFVRDLSPGQLAMLVASAALVPVVFLGRSRLAGPLRRVPDVVPPFLAAALVILAGYAFFLRYPQGALAAHDASALRTFAWYVTAPGLLAAVAGTALLLPRLFWRSPAFFATATAFSLFFFYKIRIVPQHFWMTRRFLPVILPASLIMIAGLVVACTDPHGPVARWLQRRLPETGTPLLRRRTQLFAGGLSLVLVAALAVAFWRAAAPIRGHVEYAGMIGHLSRILEQSGPEDLLLVESRGASDMHVLALPLAYIYGRDVLVLTTKNVDIELLGGFVSWALGRYRNVYFLGHGQPLLSKHLGVLQVWNDVFWVPEYESVPNAYPSAVKLKEFRYQQCRLVTGEEAEVAMAQPVVPLDDVHLVDFHDTERDQRGAWRWSRGESGALLTNIGPDTTAILISMENGGRPASAPPAVVEVTLADRVLGRVAVGEGTRSYEFAVPRDLARELAASSDPTRLRLAVSSWMPKRLLGTPDDRELGVMVSHIEVSSAPLDTRAGVSSPERND